MLDYVVSSKIPVVTSNHKFGGELAARKFIDSGCKNVIHICGYHAAEVLSYQCHIALENMLHTHSVTSTAVEIKWNDFDFEEYLNLAKKY